MTNSDFNLFSITFILVFSFLVFGNYFREATEAICNSDFLAPVISNYLSYLRKLIAKL